MSSWAPKVTHIVEVSTFYIYVCTRGFMGGVTMCRQFTTAVDYAKTSLLPATTRFVHGEAQLPKTNNIRTVNVTPSNLQRYYKSLPNERSTCMYCICTRVRNDDVFPSTVLLTLAAYRPNSKFKN
jgi:hypothetical protein